MSIIKQNLDNVQNHIQKTCNRVGRDFQSVTFIAVTKTQPIDAMKEAIEWGVLHVGENKVQEIVNKQLAFDSDLQWHMIGHLQTNKVKMIIDKVALIHSVDSYKLAEKVNEEAYKINKVQNILIQINIADEETKFGIGIVDAEALIHQVSHLKNVRITGLMTIAPYVENPEDNRLVFRQLNEIFVDINKKNIDNVIMNTLSMGMTNDYEVAIEEGSTMVRIGTAIFGERDYQMKG